MPTASSPATSPPAPRRPASALERLTLSELKLLIRERVGPIFAIGLPLALLIIFGNIRFYTERHTSGTFAGRTLLEVYVPILAAFALATLSFNVVPAVLAGYREKGVLRRLRTTPVGPARVLAAT
jgi:ABC-2 type transport system permease protein